MEVRHSGLGIASFAISIGVGLMMFLLFAVAGVMEASTPGGIDDESVGAILIGLGLFALLALCLLGIGLGVAALFQQGRGKALPVLGVVIGGGVLLLTGLLLVLGTLA